MKKTLNNFLFGLGSLALFTTPVLENNVHNEILKSFESKYSTIDKLFSSRDFMECISIVDEIKYVADSVAYGFNYWQKPEETILKGEGNCDDKATLLQYLLEQKSIPSYLFVSKRNLNSSSAHLAVFINYNKNNYVIDPSSRTSIFGEKIDVTRIFEGNKIGRSFYFALDKKEYLGIRKRSKEYKKRTGRKIFIYNSFRQP